MNEEVEKFKRLVESQKGIAERKIRLEEQLKSKKKTLTSLVSEVKEKGYDPSKLTPVIQEMEKDIKKSISDYETALKEADEKLSKIEACL